MLGWTSLWSAMATTSQGAALTEQHRLAQQQVRNDFLVEFLAMWALLDSTRLDDTSPGWVRAVMSLIRQYRQKSARVATDYYQGFAAVEAPVGAGRIEIPGGASRPPSPPPVRPAPARRQPARTPEPVRTSRFNDQQVAPRDRRARLEMDESAFSPRIEGDRRARIEIPDIDWAPSDRAAQVSLTVTGPVNQKSKASRGKPLQVARDESFTQAAGAASRHVLNGGRQSLLTLVEGDMRAIGWIRVTDGDPCSFCAMLASRGAVYKEDSFSRSDPRFTGPGEFKVHDSCACTMEVVYSRQAAWPGRGDEFYRMWRDDIEGRHSGADARRVWRRLYEQRRRDERRTEVA